MIPESILDSIVTCWLNSQLLIKLATAVAFAAQPPKDRASEIALYTERPKRQSANFKVYLEYICFHSETAFILFVGIDNDITNATQKITCQNSV